MVFYVIIAIILLIVIYTIIQYNILVKANNNVNEAFSTMDVYLKKRWDMIPNLVEIVKGYAEHEKETFIKITNLRSGNYQEMTLDKKINVNEELSQKISKIMAVSENYPELKASENFSELSKTLTKIEDEIASSRKYYNGTVRELNNKIQMFPSNIVANLCGFKEAKSFEVNIGEKDNVKVNL